MRDTPCKVTWSTTTPAGGPQTTSEDAADFAVAIDGEERARFFDERGNPVHAEQACLLLGKGCLRVQPGATVVLADAGAQRLHAAFKASGARVRSCGPDPAALWTAVHEHEAVFGAGGFDDAQHRLHYWSFDNGPVLDPVRALAAMLAALSLSDRPLSAVLPNPTASCVP
jgi:phosphomannomutase